MKSILLAIAPWTILAFGIVLGVLAWCAACAIGRAAYRDLRPRHPVLAVGGASAAGLLMLFVWPVTIPWWLHRVVSARSRAREAGDE
ncbi:hypothetical protein ACPA54_02355 [Uniformispora flossi]|uniref:hypothetical protein n=1 Tax=Uniformispora flossi TaxID=3390723 RepID=UPI003C2B83AC